MDFISSAYAMAGQPGGGGGENIFASLMPFALIFLVFYFLLIRPQQKKAKEHKEMLASLKKGDAVITAGGMYGRILDVLEGDVMLVDLGETKVKMGRAYLAPAPGSRKVAPQPPKKEKKGKKAVKEAAETPAVEAAPIEAPVEPASPAAEARAEAAKPEETSAVPADDNKDKPAV